MCIKKIILFLMLVLPIAGIATVTQSKEILTSPFKDDARWYEQETAAYAVDASPSKTSKALLQSVYISGFEDDRVYGAILKVILGERLTESSIKAIPQPTKLEFENTSKKYLIEATELKRILSNHIIAKKNTSKIKHLFESISKKTKIVARYNQESTITDLVDILNKVEILAEKHSVVVFDYSSDVTGSTILQDTLDDLAANKTRLDERSIKGLKSIIYMDDLMAISIAHALGTAESKEADELLFSMALSDEMRIRQAVAKFMNPNRVNSKIKNITKILLNDKQELVRLFAASKYLQIEEIAEQNRKKISSEAILGVERNSIPAQKFPKDSKDIRDLNKAMKE